MSHHPVNSCDCMEGEILIYYKNEGQRFVRSDWAYCTICLPDSKSSANLKSGETEIDVNEYTILLKNKEWREVSS
jgi:hypothetical protein